MAFVAIADINLRQGMKAEALKAIEQAILANPAQRGQLARSRAFSSLASDPDFQRLTR